MNPRGQLNDLQVKEQQFSFVKTVDSEFTITYPWPQLKIAHYFKQQFSIETILDNALSTLAM